MNIIEMVVEQFKDAVLACHSQEEVAEYLELVTETSNQFGLSQEANAAVQKAILDAAMEDPQVKAHLTNLPEDISSQ